MTQRTIMYRNKIYAYEYKISYNDALGELLILHLVAQSLPTITIAFEKIP